MLYYLQLGDYIFIAFQITSISNKKRSNIDKKRKKYFLISKN
jgi:hypothetical protein